MCATPLSHPIWTDLPTTIRIRIVDELVERADASEFSLRGVSGGFSPGLTCILRSSARSLFVKAVHDSQPSVAVSLVRDERDVLVALPPRGYPVPRLRLAIEDEGWTVLVTDAVDGQSPADAIDEAELSSSLDALVHLGREYAPDVSLPTTAERYEELFDHVPGVLRDRPELTGGMSRTEAASLVESAVVDASSGSDLVHGDLRGDNVVLDGSGRAWLVDWAWGCRGQRWADAVTLICAAQAVRAEARWQLLTRHPATAQATAQQLRGYAIAITGMYTWASQQPPPPDLVRLREWQAKQARSAQELVLASYRAS